MEDDAVAGFHFLGTGIGADAGRLTGPGHRGVDEGASSEIP